MPGRREKGGRAVSPAIHYRTVSSADSNAAADIEALDPIEYFDTVQYAADNKLIIQTVAPAAVTNHNIEVWMSLVSESTSAKKIQDEGQDRWALLAEATSNTRSAIVILPNFAVGDIKILITSITGSGDIEIYFAHTM